MDERLEDDDGTVLVGLSNVPPRRKVHSYSHQFRTITGTHHKRWRHQLRKHYIDENHILNKRANNKNNDFYNLKFCTGQKLQRQRGRREILDLSAPVKRSPEKEPEINRRNGTQSRARTTDWERETTDFCAKEDTGFC
ncbi:Uncharacterized protein Fot_54794 [Forsythia ovata]|uniref:Uncharacterized protein n=1 Tax=Forsythia ovata TaxID=205694 RepID=A0ABD1P6P6_9LAMI